MISPSRYQTHLLRTLCNANQAILNQKIALLDLLTTKHDADHADLLFSKVCPIVGASIGQHYRHSMDHLELVALVAASASATPPPSSKTNVGKDIRDNVLSSHPPKPVTLHYDLRVRGGKLETDIALNRSRIRSVWKALRDIHNDNDQFDQYNLKAMSKNKEKSNGDFSVGNQPVNASFLLTSASPNDTNIETNHLELRSSIERELGFVAHHAIHHMAMVKIIAIETVGLDARDLPSDFGRAPSTVQHDNGITNVQKLNDPNNSDN